MNIHFSVTSKLILQVETPSAEDVISARSLLHRYILESSSESLKDAVWRAQAALLLAARPMQTLDARQRVEESA